MRSRMNIHRTRYGTEALLHILAIIKDQRGAYDSFFVIDEAFESSFAENRFVPFSSIYSEMKVS